METSLPLVAFVVAATTTPGPNNLLVLAWGANWGLARTLPHILGIALGLPVMIVAVGLGVSVVFDAAPWLHSALQFAGFAYLCWLAWRLATAVQPGKARGIRRPLNVWQAAAFQWVNPKAWALLLGGMTVFVDPAGNKLLQVLAIALLFASWPFCSSPRCCRRSLECAPRPAYAAGGLANTMAGRNPTPEAGKCDSSSDRD